MATQELFSASEIKERFEKLPGDIRGLIYSAQMTEIIQKIGNTYRLHIDQTGNLEAETSFLMLGFTEPGDFVRVLSERIPVDKVTAAALAEAVNNELLVKIRDSLKTAYPDMPGPGASTRPGAQPASKLFAQTETPKPSLKAALPMQQGAPIPILSAKSQIENAPPPIIPGVTQPITTPVQTPTPVTSPLPAHVPSTVPEISTPTANNTPPVNAPAAPAVKPLGAVDEALLRPNSSVTEKVDVGVPATQSQGYKDDPYREPIE